MTVIDASTPEGRRAQLAGALIVPLQDHGAASAEFGEAVFAAARLFGADVAVVGAASAFGAFVTGQAGPDDDGRIAAEAVALAALLSSLSEGGE